MYRGTLPVIALALALAAPAVAQGVDTAYTFERGFPASDTARKAYDDADLNRAIKLIASSIRRSRALRFSRAPKARVVPNKVFGTLDTQPQHVGFTLNSDTPYGPVARSRARSDGGRASAWPAHLHRDGHQPALGC